MKKEIFKIALSMIVVGTAIIAQENKHDVVEMTAGMKVFKKKMRKGCRSTGLRFSKSHTKHQWEVIYKNGMLQREAKVLCPHLNTSILNDKEWNEIYTFVSNHSSDNPVIPKC